MDPIRLEINLHIFIDQESSVIYAYMDKSNQVYLFIVDMYIITILLTNNIQLASARTGTARAHHVPVHSWLNYYHLHTALITWLPRLIREPYTSCAQLS